MSGVVEQKTADLAAAGSAALAGATWIADLAPIMQLAATIVAVFAGAAAAWYHVERILYMRHKRKDHDNTYHKNRDK